MKKVLLILSLSALSLFAQTNEGPIITAIDGYAARVDNTIITYGEIRESVSPYIQHLMQNLQGAELSRQIQAAYLDGRESLIEEALMKSEAKRLGLALPPSIIETEADRLIEERFEGSRTLLSLVLAERRMTFDEWLEELSDQLTLRVYYSQEVMRKAIVSDEAVREEYERVKEEFFIPFRVKYRFILINRGTTDEEQTLKRKQAEDTLQKLREGASFSTIADNVSEGDTSVSPWRDPADVKKELRDALNNTPAGDISEIIETADLFYIVKVEGRREEGYTPFNTVKETLENDLLANERKRLHDELIERLSSHHYIERY